MGKGWSYVGVALTVLAGWLYDQSRKPKVQVTFYQGEKGTEAEVRAKTVGDAVREAGFSLKPQDVVVPALSEAVTGGMEIDLGLVERRVKEEKKRVPAPVNTVYTDTLNAGEIIDVQLGKDGLADQQTESFFLNGQAAFEKVLKSTVLVPAKNAKVLEGTSLRQKMYPLRKRARVWKTVTLEATAYYPGPEDTWPYTAGYTATGLKAGYGVVAVDPRIIRLKTPIYVEGYGYALAADKGGAIKGNRIDLCFDTYEEAVRFGRKKVQVYLLR